MPTPTRVALRYGPEPLNVSVIHRHTRYKASTYVVSAADGRIYLLKAFSPELDSTYGRREIFVHAIGARLGLSMMPWALLQVDESVLAQFRAGNVKSTSADELSEGVYFGSQLYTGPGSVCEYFPQGYARKNPEVARQLGCAHMFNLWNTHAVSHGCWILLKGVPTRISFFICAHLLNENELSAARALDTYRAACRTAENRHAIHHFLTELGTLTRADLEAAFVDVPLFWRDPDEEAEETALLEARRNWISDLARSNFSIST